ncbi:multiprotein-bridging factor 1 family protein [Streptomyces libani]|uniref:helix-turn-helix domain-containing protein n=1 Tax=Streptomyces nigrescens TaxID=1920 RepID=UPI0037F97738
MREAAGLTQQDVATALQKKRETVNGWETGRTTPRPPRLAAYQHLLNGWAERYPATDDAGVRRPKGGDAPDASLPRDE